MRPASAALVVLLMTAATLPLGAQRRTSASAATGLEARMQAFLREIQEAPNTGLAAFFPRRGDWTWVQTLRDERGGRRTGIWRFPGKETLRAIGEGGPVCDSFNSSGGEVGPVEWRLGMQALMRGGPWRRVRGNRFVPAGASARSPVFVEWRREDGRWVVSAFGDEDLYLPPLLGRDAGEIVPDTLTPLASPRYAANAGWYIGHQPIVLTGWRYVKDHPPYRLSAEDAARLRRVGVLEGVIVYAEPAEGIPEMLWVPVSPGEFQPYTGFGAPPCR